MYGLVNKAIEGLVCSNFGQPAWDQIRREAGLEDETFISMETYSDCVTYRLVAAASKVLQLPPSTVLEAFGEYWTLYTAKEGYGEMFRSEGNDLFAFLDNLNAMHGRIETIYPEMVLPHFECHLDDAGNTLLHYRSHRAGLAPMVVGLVRGLAKMFNQPVQIEHIVKRDEGNEEDVFRLTPVPALG